MGATPVVDQSLGDYWSGNVLRNILKLPFCTVQGLSVCEYVARAGSFDAKNIFSHHLVHPRVISKLYSQINSIYRAKWLISLVFIRSPWQIRFPAFREHRVIGIMSRLAALIVSKFSERIPEQNNRNSIEYLVGAAKCFGEIGIASLPYLWQNVLCNHG